MSMKAILVGGLLVGGEAFALLCYEGNSSSLDLGGHHDVRPTLS